MTYYFRVAEKALLLLLLLVPGPAYSVVHEYRLDNGLKLLVKPDIRAPVVVSQIWYKVGSSYEYNGITGVSHALEHMMFKGTKLYPDGEFSRIISENGGRNNAFTGLDYTTYFQALEKSRLEISFKLEADRMHNLVLSEEEFDKEIEVVKEERRWRTEDDPQSFLSESALAVAFQTSPYRYPVIGWMRDLDGMTLKKLEDWYQKWYVPNNATVVVVGDVIPDEVHVLAKKYFGVLSPGETITAPLADEVKQQGIKRVTVKQTAELPYLMMLYKAPSIKPGTFRQNNCAWEPYALEVLTRILDGGDSARFASRLIRGAEVAASVNAGYQMVSRLDNLLSISGTPAKGSTIKDLERAIRKEIINLQINPVTGEELQRVKTQVISEDIYEKDSLFFQAYVIGILETIGLSWRFADEYVECVKAVTAAQIMTVAKKYLVEDRLTIAELDPQPLDKKESARPLAGGRRFH